MVSGMTTSCAVTLSCKAAQLGTPKQKYRSVNKSKKSYLNCIFLGGALGLGWAGFCFLVGLPSVLKP